MTRRGSPDQSYGRQRKTENDTLAFANNEVDGTPLPLVRADPHPWPRRPRERIGHGA